MQEQEERSSMIAASESKDKLLLDKEVEQPAKQASREKPPS